MQANKQRQTVFCLHKARPFTCREGFTLVATAPWTNQIKTRGAGFRLPIPSFLTVAHASLLTQSRVSCSFGVDCCFSGFRVLLPGK